MGRMVLVLWMVVRAGLAAGLQRPLLPLVRLVKEILVVRVQ